MILSVIHRKVLYSLRGKAFYFDIVNGDALVKYNNFIKVCNQQRLTKQEAKELLNEMQSLGLVIKLNKNKIKIRGDNVL